MRIHCSNMHLLGKCRFFFFNSFLFGQNQPLTFFFSYQYGPDTYLLQLRDVNFPVRLREYMKVAKKSTSEGFDWQVIK